MNAVPAIRAEGIGVSFGGVSVLRDVTLEIAKGEIHGLVGENGAGKSTLGKVIGGYYAASTGRLSVFGQPVENWNPPEALSRGVAIMHQELQLVPAMTVAQNVFLGLEDARMGVLRRNEAQRLAELTRAHGFDVDPSAVVSDLPIAEQQKIEILRALARNARVIVMDEPTSSLSRSEIDQLHATMRRLKAAGHSVVYVSHFLGDILSVCDTVTVLRDGDHVRTGPATAETRETLVEAMLGSGKTATYYPPRYTPPKAGPALEVEGLSSPNGTTDVSLTVGRGEIVGLIGLVGSGRTEIARAILGIDTATGSIRLQGQPYVDRSPSAGNQLGLVMIPEDRRKQGLVLTMPVRPNMTLPHLARYAWAGIMRPDAERRRVRNLIELFSIRPTAVDGKLEHYSGGNQQKVLIGKWLMEGPVVVILDEPSRGVDVGAREKIHQAIAELAAGGAGVLLISSEIDEVLGLAHRAYLVDGGRVFEEIDPNVTDEATALSALFRRQAAGTRELS
jgi:ribose transport system ATP-binding protein